LVLFFKKELLSSHLFFSVDIMTPTKSPPVVLITGASSGIGLAAAQILHARGARVWGASRRVIAGEIPWIAMDVTDDEAVDAGVRKLIEKAGRIDALITCAGYGIAGAIEDTSSAEAQAQFATNFFGTFRAVRAVLPAMRAQEAGRIVLVGSIAGRIGVPFQGFYSASKFALEGFAESLRMEVKPFGIDVSLIEPGDFKTDFTAARCAWRARMPPRPITPRSGVRCGRCKKMSAPGPIPRSSPI